MQTAALAARVVFSLVVVLVVMWFAVRALRKGQKRSVGGVRVEVLARQPLAQRSSVAIVRIGERALVLGVTESRIDLLAEHPIASLLTEDDAAGEVLVGVATDVVSTQLVPKRSRSRARSHQAVTARPAPTGRLAGSALSPQTWSKALNTVRELTVRR